MSSKAAELRAINSIRRMCEDELQLPPGLLLPHVLCLMSYACYSGAARNHLKSRECEAECACACVCVCVCVCIHDYIYVNMYIHTHIRIHTAELRAIISIVECPYALCLMPYILCLMPVTAELRAIISIVECEDDFPPEELRELWY